MVDLTLLKKHCKIDHTSEDNLLLEYYSWAKHDIASAVTTKDIDWLEGHPLFKAAVYPLTSYYFENRIAFEQRNLNYAPHMVLSVVHKLRDAYEIQLEQTE
ncbi:head-tail connector protein [Staphylococcus felis]|uniref:head-tail connector protein n=1 Tax=Staphylococcus felis TaxID=46127 RepID=UPI00396710F1